MPVIFRMGDDTEAFLGLAENLDFQKYDVTLLVCGGGDDLAEEQIIGLPTGLRILYRGQPFNGKAEEIAKNELFLKGKIKVFHMLFTRERQGACLERRNSTVQLTLPGKRACFQWWQRRWMAFGFSNTMHVCPGKTDCKGAGRPAGNRICHRKLLYCQIPGKQSSCYYRGSHSGTGYRENQLYLYVPAESPERSEGF
mgnify:CR=1 FL=1